jgi:hypothetical protein
MIYANISGIPWQYYYNFVLEEKHGFNKQVNENIYQSIKTH